MTSSEYGVAIAMRDAFSAFSARPSACAEVSDGTPDASVMRFTVTTSSSSANRLAEVCTSTITSTRASPSSLA